VLKEPRFNIYPWFACRKPLSRFLDARILIKGHTVLFASTSSSSEFDEDESLDARSLSRTWRTRDTYIL
jgi:hypothetical protein